MTDEETAHTTRRTVLGAAGSAAIVGLAGCVGGDDGDGGNSTGSGDGGETAATATVTLLAEQTSPHEGGLPEDNVSHACEHFEFGDREELTGTPTAGEAPEISATHQLFDVTIDGASGHVVFHGGGDHNHEGDGHDHEGETDHEEDEGSDEHNHEEEDGHSEGEGESDGHDHGGENGHSEEEAYAFFVDGGSATVVQGDTVHEESSGVPACGPADMYVLARPEERRVVLELSG